MSQNILNEDGISDDEEDYGVSHSKEIARYRKIRVTSDLPSLKHELKHYRKNALKSNISKRPCVNLGKASINAIGLLDIVENYDRPADARTKTTYADAGTYAIRGFRGKTGQRLPKAGAYAYAGIAEASAEYSILSARVSALHAGAEARASVNELGLSAMGTAELVSVSANAGPVGLKLGLAADTGVRIGATGIEAKVLGTGFSIGPKTSVSLLGSEVSFAIM